MVFVYPFVYQNPALRFQKLHLRNLQHISRYRYTYTYTCVDSYSHNNVHNESENGIAEGIEAFASTIQSFVHEELAARMA